MPIRIIRIKHSVCDGKQCGTGTHKGGGKYLCKHNNLAILRPDLAKEWHYDKNDTYPEDYTFKSNKKVWWKCKDNNCDCHIWIATISNRSNGTGCPFCKSGKACKHNNLAKNYPSLLEEWFFERNIEKNPYEIAVHSNEKMWWRCKNSNCGCHIWNDTVYNRTLGRGCPYCNKGRPCPHYNLKIIFPELADEWYHQENEGLSPEDINPRSGKKYWWYCRDEKNCGCHIWRATIYNRTIGRGCPYCKSGKTCKHDNLSLNKKLISEWDWENNTISPYDVTIYSHLRVNWICSLGHKWSARIHDRHYRDRGCSKCSDKGYSKAQIEWMEEIMKEENIHIQHATNKGEYYIEGVGRVDGYCEETNTVYEYHGSFWHGNPDVYKRDDINPVSGKTYGELYDKTLERGRKVRSLGYNLIEKWE